MAPSPLDQRWQNSRNFAYKTMVLDERFREYFQDWQQPLLQFKPEGDPDLRQNPHNDLMLELDDVFKGKAKPKVCYVSLDLIVKHTLY